MSHSYWVCQNNFCGIVGLVFDRVAVRTGFRSASESAKASDGLVHLTRQLHFHSFFCRIHYSQRTIRCYVLHVVEDRHYIHRKEPNVYTK